MKQKFHMNSNKLNNICFVANFYKTFLFHELSKKLILSGVNIFWIVTKLEQYNFLKEHYPVSTILYINRTFINKPNTIVDDFRLNELVYGDRVFKHEIENGLKFLTHIQKPIYDFLSRNQINLVFGETTWAHELLILRIAKKRKELGCQYLEPSMVRIPNNQFGFFCNEEQNELIGTNEQESITEIVKLAAPSYLKINDKIVKANKSIVGRLNRLNRFFNGKNIEKDDPNVIVNKLIRSKVAAIEELNKNTYSLVKTVSFEQIENENYIFYGFHKQPEASIDVLGRYYEDQIVIILNLWRLLPNGWKVVVKEHTNAIGDRSYGFYKRIMELPNVLIVNEKTDSKKIIQKSKLVATVSGTIAYEAALLKKPAITFAKVFFNRINYCRYVSLNDLVQLDIATLANELETEPDNRLDFSNYLMKHTFSGYISDLNTDSTVMEEQNINKLYDAFIKVISNPN